MFVRDFSQSHETYTMKTVVSELIATPAPEESIHCLFPAFSHGVLLLESSVLRILLFPAPRCHYVHDIYHRFEVRFSGARGACTLQGSSSSLFHPGAPAETTSCFVLFVDGSWSQNPVVDTAIVCSVSPPVFQVGVWLRLCWTPGL